MPTPRHATVVVGEKKKRGAVEPKKGPTCSYIGWPFAGLEPLVLVVVQGMESFVHYWIVWDYEIVEAWRR